MAKLIELRNVYKIYSEGLESEVRALDGVSLDIEYMIIWAEHCAEESQLLWRFSFLLRLVK